jgi:hypothetical protein
LLDHDGRALDVAVMTEEQIVHAILLWSALPGASRHHWGTEIDLIDRAALAPRAARAVDSAGIQRRKGYSAGWAPGCRGTARPFGFFLPYDRDRGGVRPEPWHLSFAPVSGAALPALTVELLAAALGEVELAGCGGGAPTAGDIHARYVCAVAQPSGGGAGRRAAQSCSQAFLK